MTHLCVIQDDAIPQPGFADRLQAAVDARPESLLLGFVPGFAHFRVEMIRAQKAGRDTIPFRVGSFVPTVCIVYPRDVAHDLLRWAGGRPRPMQGADDGIVALYARKRRLHPIALAPCLVDHDDTVKSIGRDMKPGRHRRAALL